MSNGLLRADPRIGLTVTAMGSTPLSSWLLRPIPFILPILSIHAIPPSRPSCPSMLITPSRHSGESRNPESPVAAPAAWPPPRPRRLPPLSLSKGVRPLSSPFVAPRAIANSGLTPSFRPYPVIPALPRHSGESRNPKDCILSILSIHVNHPLSSFRRKPESRKPGRCTRRMAPATTP